MNVGSFSFRRAIPAGGSLNEPGSSISDADRRFSMAVEHVAEAVAFTDRDGRITYVNPAFERVTGYLREEVVGKNPGLLESGFQTVSFYEAIWSALASGKPWAGDLVSRHKDGSLFTEAATISPVRDSWGSTTGCVVVKRDLTHERALANRSSRLARERALIAETIRALRAGDTPEATAQEICRRIVGLIGVTAAQLTLFEPDGYARPIGFVVEGQPDPPLHRLPDKLSRHLREWADAGPWIEPRAGRREHAYSQILGGLDGHVVAQAPVRHDERLIGLLAVNIRASARDVAVIEAMPALVEFADLAGALIGRDVAANSEAGLARDYILGTIANKAFQPVFQPIAELGPDDVVGYEALTRFDDGADPQAVFSQAASVGLGIELEIATLEACLEASIGLAQSTWLNLNASPDLIMSGEPFMRLIRGFDRHLVIEVTEHTAILNYPAFRAAVAALGPNVELAVDDAGVGFASLRHILELRPAFVKLDRWLVADLHNDHARQAMIVGLRHFAQATGCRLIAEGIEIEHELAVLRSLNVALGQGYLMGHPLTADQVRTPRPAVTLLA
jgi:PAS domain S-box-containing protein